LLLSEDVGSSLKVRREKDLRVEVVPLLGLNSNGLGLVWSEVGGRGGGVGGRTRRGRRGMLVRERGGSGVGEVGEGRKD